MIKRIEKYGAEWCQPCKVLDKTLSQVDIEITRYDIENNPDLAQEKGIRNIPVLIYYDENDKEVTRTVGAVPLGTILNIINK